ncbi:hypothetical protein ES705_18744 [subsurface metagenome]
MKNIILIITMALLIGCELDPVIVQEPDIPIIIYHAYSHDKLNPYTITYKDPKDADLTNPQYKPGNIQPLRDTTFIGQWTYRMPFEGDLYFFYISICGYVHFHPDSTDFDYTGIYLTKDSSSTSDKYDVHFNIYYSESDVADSVCVGSPYYWFGDYYREDGPRWTCIKNISYKYINNPLE